MKRNVASKTIVATGDDDGRSLEEGGRRKEEGGRRKEEEVRRKRRGNRTLMYNIDRVMGK